MKYKVGDKVRIQSLEWYKKEIESEKWCPNTSDIYWCSREMTISKIEKSHYLMEEDGQEFWWIDEMIEGLVEEEMPLDKAGQMTDFEYEGLAYTLPEGYQFVDENGNVINATKIVLEKKKKEYPKTYEECCKMLEIEGNSLLINTKHITDYERDLGNLMGQLHRLIICRDAYWKIAGEKMGLGKPWEPDWSDDNAKYSIYTIKGALTKAISCYDGAILTFPTKEMRDAFYEAFKELIESCKELL